MVVTIWNEFLHERQEQCVKELYPEGIHRFIGSFLSQDPELEIQYATLDMPEHGLTQEVLERTDVLVWWGHMGHDQVQDQVVERVGAAGAAGHGVGLPPLSPPLQNFPQAYGHQREPCVGGRSVRTHLYPHALPSHWPGRAWYSGTGCRGNVRRAVRYPSAGRADLWLLV